MMNIEFNTADMTEETKKRIVDYVYNHYSDAYDFLVLDDSTQDSYLLEQQEESLWAYNTNFIMDYLKDGIEYSEGLEKAVKMVQEEMCESANEFIKAITDWEQMILDAARYDGYGYYLNSYDGEEEELNIDGKTFYIYYN